MVFNMIVEVPVIWVFFAYRSVDAYRSGGRSMSGMERHSVLETGRRPVP